MKKARFLFILLMLAFSFFLLFSCKGKEEEPIPAGDALTGDPYLSSYGDNVVDYDALS